MSFSQFVAMLVGVAFVAASVLMKHWIAGGPWRLENFYLGAELTMATVANGVNTITKNVLNGANWADETAHAVFVTLNVMVLMYVLYEHKRTETSSDAYERMMVLTLGTNIVGALFFCGGFIMGVS